jgi:AcrR family transcriptional regulator
VGLASQSERRQSTRAALIAAARASFVEQGFDATSTDAVLARAGVSKGALYHHFASKVDLLAAVFEAVSRELVAQAQAAMTAEMPAPQGLGLTLKAWLRAVMDVEPRRIILETGPAVLGFARAREIEEGIALVPMRRGITRAVEQGLVTCADPDLAARLLNATVYELALAAIQRGLGEGELASLDPYIDRVMAALLHPVR